MRILLSRLAKDERGLSTAEYAVGTVAVAGLGGILIKLLTSDAVKDLIFSVITSAFKAIFGGLQNHAGVGWGAMLAHHTTPSEVLFYVNVAAFSLKPLSRFQCCSVSRCH